MANVIEVIKFLVIIGVLGIWMPLISYAFYLYFMNRKRGKGMSEPAEEREEEGVIEMELKSNTEILLSSILDVLISMEEKLDKILKEEEPKKQ